MQAQAFIRKWSPGSPAHDLGERAGAQAHFIDLCRVLGVGEPDDKILRRLLALNLERAAAQPGKTKA